MTTPPRISVIIPTCGRPAALARCLEALGRSTLAPADLEIVVVGDGPLVRAPPEGAAGPVRVVWHTQRHRGPAAARNLGARSARAPVLAFTDDDCAPTPEWAERMLAHVDAAPGAVIGGRVRNGLPGRPWSVASHLTLDVLMDMYNGRPGKAGFSPTSNLALHREVFERVGGFHEAFGTAASEDREFCDRSHAAGHDLVIGDSAVIEHFHDLDARRYLRQHLTYGRSEETYRRVSAEQGRAINLGAGFYGRLARAALGTGPVRGSVLAARAVAGQVAYQTGFWVTRARARR